MTETLNEVKTDSNTIVLYTFCFNSIGKSIQLTQEQLNHIPYLAILIAHKDDFLSIQNQYGEYVLDYSIDYISFITILNTIASQNPYVLFNELSEDHNMMKTLRLRDYLGVNSFSLPLLRCNYLILTNPYDNKNDGIYIKYRRATLLEARQTAAELVVALSRNEYNLIHNKTRKQIFMLIKVILSSVTIFSARFRHHTLEVVKECCFSFFSKNRQNQLLTTFQMTQYSNIDIFMYLDDDNQLCPYDLFYTFAWRGTNKLKENEQTNSLIVDIIEDCCYSSDQSDPNSNLSIFRNVGFELLLNLTSRTPFSIITMLRSFSPLFDDRLEEEEKKYEALLAQSGQFNTLPRRPTIDKFKHRSRSKTQKYR